MSNKPSFYERWGRVIRDIPMSDKDADQEFVPGMMIHGTHEVACTYRNWRGETAPRRIGAMSVWFGSTEWHPEPQWFLRGLDLDKHEVRDFALRDMADVSFHREPSGAERALKDKAND